VTVRAGRYGPYVNHGKVNATLPKSVKPEETTLEQAVDLLAEKAGKPTAGKVTAKKPSPGKVASKKPTNRRPAAKETAGRAPAKGKAKPKSPAKRAQSK
jgi:DNA topoisomerase-1